MFRFHTGSIKSKSHHTDTYDLISFDSILVRLKATDKIDDSAITSFDSILVRLKGACPPRSVIFIVGFDSILVRLKVTDWLKSNRFVDVSIPYWFD